MSSTENLGTPELLAVVSVDTEMNFQEPHAFLHEFLTVDRLKELLPDAAEFEVLRYELANIESLNFYIKGILGEGVASSVRTDPQAKTLGDRLLKKSARDWPKPSLLPSPTAARPKQAGVFRPSRGSREWSWPRDA